MYSRTLKFCIVITVTLIASGLISTMNRDEPLKNERFFDFPLSIGDWKGRDIPMSDYVYKGIETPYLFLRDYSSPRFNAPVNLSIVWFDDTNIAFHTPEACLGGVSNEVKGKGKIYVKLDKEYEMEKFITNLGGTDYLVLYFFDVDGFITTRQSDIRMRVLYKRLVFKRASATFVRLMAPVHTNEQETSKCLLAFLRLIYPLLPDYMYTKAATSPR
jgi:EpsI family protein